MMADANGEWDVLRETKARTIAAYAMNLLHGASLAYFERQNLIVLCAEFQANVGADHAAMGAKLVAVEREREAELDSLRAQIVALRKRRCRWWHHLAPWAAPRHHQYRGYCVGTSYVCEPMEGCR